jgi:hypothetical protein
MNRAAFSHCYQFCWLKLSTNPINYLFFCTSTFHLYICALTQNLESACRNWVKREIPYLDGANSHVVKSINIISTIQYSCCNVVLLYTQAKAQCGQMTRTYQNSMHQIQCYLIILLYYCRNINIIILYYNIISSFFYYYLRPSPYYYLLNNT